MTSATGLPGLNGMLRMKNSHSLGRPSTTSELVEYAKPAEVRAGSPAATKNVGVFEIWCCGGPLSVKR